MRKILLILGVIILLSGCTKGVDIEKTSDNTDEALTNTEDVDEADGDTTVIDEASSDTTDTVVEEVDPALPYEPGAGIAVDNGPLQVIDGQLSNAAGEPIQLKGMSSHGLQWSGSMITDGSMATLVNDWDIDIFRGAMYTTEDGYVSDSYKSFNLMRMETALALATKYGIYYMVDWHVLRDKDPLIYMDEAKEFFGYMSEKYKNYDNIIYEICNEPNGNITWDDNVKPYAEEIIPIIRANDPDAVIIVGSPSWSQRLDEAADNPLAYDNILYTLHFYAGSHGQELRDVAEYAMNKGLGIFVTERGTTESSGAGPIYIEESDAWLDFLDEHMISWCNWSFSAQAEQSAALLVNSDPNGNWPDDRLTESGLYVRSKLQE